MTRELTLSDMKDNLLRLQATESHARMFCGQWTNRKMFDSVTNLKHAIAGLEDELEEIDRLEEESNDL